MDEPEAHTPVELFWQEARKVAGINRLDVVVGSTARAALTPPAWSFDPDPRTADELVAEVLAGTRTASSSPLRAWEAGGEELPAAGDLSILLDGREQPAALLRHDDVDVVPFDEVPASHAVAEGEPSLADWRRRQHRAFTDLLAAADGTFDSRAPVVLERFRVLHPRPRRRGQQSGS